MVDDDCITVEPEYRHSNVMATSRWLSNDKTKIYPVDVGRHSVKVRYTYAKQYGQQKLVGLEYYCTKCDHRTSVEHDRLYEADDEDVATTRGWMYGYFYEHDCV